MHPARRAHPLPGAVPHRRFTGAATGHSRTVPGSTTQTRSPRTCPLEWGLAALGGASLLAAALVAPSHARAAAAQDWPAFVLVAGLLLVGLMAEEDGLFDAGGRALALVAPNGLALYAGTALLVVTVTTLLNLDTSVTFLTPVLVYAARGRGEGEAALLYGCLLLSNAGSLMLPGSNLTNLIVLGHLHLSGGAYFAHMALPAVGAAVATALVVGAVHHRTLRTTITSTAALRTSPSWAWASSRSPPSPCSWWCCARRPSRWLRSGWARWSSGRAGTAAPTARPRRCPRRPCGSWASPC